MAKNLLLISTNYAPEPTGIGRYNGEMIDWLSRNGFNCTVITSFPYYPHWEIQAPYKGKAFWYKKEKKEAGGLPIEVYRCPQYIPRTPTGLKRILLDLTFFLTSSLVLMKLLFRKKYDYVVCVAPSFQLGLLGAAAKKFCGCMFIYHIQDLQVDAARDLRMIRSQRLISLMIKLEKFILGRADVVTSISTGMIEKVRNKFTGEVSYFPNWSDTQSFFPIPGQSRRRGSYSANETDKIILYSGAIGEKQGLEQILLAAKTLEIRKDLKFLVCGSGPYKKKLRSTAAKMRLRNIDFLPLQPAEKLNDFLNQADVHLVIQRADASDLVMPSKLCNILSAGGLAVVTAPQASSLYHLISSQQIGLLAEPGNPQDLANCILSALSGDQAYIKSNARKYAEEHLSIDKVMTRFVNGLPVDPKVNFRQIIRQFWVEA